MINLFGLNGGFCSFDIDNTQGKSLSIPTDMETLSIYDFSGYLDLSGLVRLKNATIGATKASAKFVFNHNLEYLDHWGSIPSIEFNGETAGDYCYLNDNNSSLIQLIINNYNNVGLCIRCGNFDFSNINGCKKIIELSEYQDVNGSYSFINLNRLTNLQSIEFLYGGRISISDVSSLAHLTSVKIDGSIDSDILEKLPIQNLTELELKNSKFTNVYPLLNASKLEVLDLSGGNIFERFSYQDETGENHTNVSTLQVFVDLKNKYGKLKKLYLKDCPNIQNYSVLNGTSWEDWSGFNEK